MKSGRSVTVRGFDVDTRDTAVLLTYDEDAGAEHSGNRWGERSPSIALSADGKTLAFAADDGLHTLDLASGRRRTLVARTVEGKDEDPSSWSPRLEGAYLLAAPSWSANGRFLSFEVAHYEGSSIHLVDLGDGRLFEQAGLPRLSYADPSLGDLRWSSHDASSVVPENGSRKTGLVLSRIGEPASGTFVPIEADYIPAAALSADAGGVAFTFAKDESLETPAAGLAVVRRDGTGRQTIDSSGDKSAPAWDDGGDVLWLEGGTLLRWDGSRSSVAARVDPSFTWEIVGFERNGIALAGRSPDQRKARFVLLNDAGESIATHQTGTDFTTYLGLV